MPTSRAAMRHWPRIDRKSARDSLVKCVACQGQRQRAQRCATRAHTRVYADRGGGQCRAPRVIAPREAAVLVNNAEDRCSVEASISFRVLNFKLQQDGDVLYRYEDGSLLQEGQLGRGHIVCGVEGQTPYGKPVFDCVLNIAWRADLLLTPKVVAPHRTHEHSRVVESIIQQLPAGRARMAAKIVASKAPQLEAQAAWASEIGSKGPPSAVLSETARFVQCRGPVADQECAQDRWEISLGHDGATQDESDLEWRGRGRGEEGFDGEIFAGFPGGGKSMGQIDEMHGTAAGPTAPAADKEQHWIAVDVGSRSSLFALLLDWGIDHALDYDVQVSLDCVKWQTVLTVVNATSTRSDDSSMHTIHFIDLRKGSSPASELVRPSGIQARFVRLQIRRAIQPTVSLWRLVLLGHRKDERMMAGKAAHRLLLYLTDKGGNELGVSSKVMTVMIIDPRPICPFVYLVYGEKYAPWLPKGLAQATDNGNDAEASGKGVERQCIFHLSTDQQRSDPEIPFNFSVARARNLLFEKVQNAGVNYLYLVFVDAEAVLEEASNYGFSSHEGAWATMEKYLLHWQPAVGFPVHAEADYDEMLEVQLVYNFNLVAVGVTAFHREAVPALLPYSTELDRQSPWQAGVIQNAVASVLYNAHRIQLNALQVTRVTKPRSSKDRGAGVWSARLRHVDALAWLAPALLSINSVIHVSWNDAFQSQPPGGGEPVVKNSTFLLRPPSHTLQGWSGSGLPWLLDHCHDYFQSKSCAAPPSAANRCPQRREEEVWRTGQGRGECEGFSSVMVTRFLSLLQEVRELQVTAQPSRSKHYWQARPFRVRSPQTGVQVGLVAASLAELQMEAADALEIHHPWSLRLLLVEPDGRGATEVLDERFFATVPANALLLALRADTLPQRLVPVSKIAAKEV